MKYIFIMSIAVLCSATGFRTANKLSRKRKELECIIDLLEEIRRKMKYCESTLENIVSEYGAAENLPFAERLAAYGKEMDFPDAWRRAFSESGSVLSENDRRIFLSLGDKLGTSDCSSQDKLIGYAVGHFSRELEKAERDESEKKRLYIVAGVASGLAFAIMMI